MDASGNAGVVQPGIVDGSRRDGSGGPGVFLVVLEAVLGILLVVLEWSCGWFWSCWRWFWWSWGGPGGPVVEFGWESVRVTLLTFYSFKECRTELRVPGPGGGGA